MGPSWHKLQCFNIISIISNVLKMIFSSICSLLVVIHQFTRVSWPQHSLFFGVTAACAHPEGNLFFTPMSQLLESTTHYPTAQIHCLDYISTHLASVSKIFPIRRNSMKHLSFIHTSISDASLSDCPFVAICHTATKQRNISGKVWSWNAMESIAMTTG